MSTWRSSRPRRLWAATVHATSGCRKEKKIQRLSVMVQGLIPAGPPPPPLTGRLPAGAAAARAGRPIPSPAVIPPGAAGGR